MLADGRGGDHDEVPRRGQSLTNVGGGRAQQSLLDEHVVGLGPGLNLYANQVIHLTSRCAVARAESTARASDRSASVSDELSS